MKYTCPVCGFDQLEAPPDLWTICPCCGTEFEYNDANFTHQELRQRWIDGGSKWWSEHEDPPEGWDPEEQLKKYESK